MEEIPTFRYHPDPLGNGVLEVSDSKCCCCNHVRGYFYKGAIYAEEDLESVCPWCIADGSLERKFDASLSDEWPLKSAGVSESIIQEVICRTPGYISWQQDSWQSCCGDACEFHGSPSRDELLNLTDSSFAALVQSSGLPLNDLREIVAQYQPDSSPAFYKFICRHCSVAKYTWDCD